MTKIEPQPEINGGEQQALKWLSESDINSLYADGCSDLIRLLISKINQLSQEVDYLRNRVNNTDSFIN